MKTTIKQSPYAPLEEGKYIVVVNSDDDRKVAIFECETEIDANDLARVLSDGIKLRSVVQLD